MHEDSKPVRACQMTIREVEARKITTIECLLKTGIPAPAGIAAPTKISIFRWGLGSVHGKWFEKTTLTPELTECHLLSCLTLSITCLLEARFRIAADLL